ncbi:MAG TPA: KamA family radical SAM protein [Candidatus Omnitrophota bacterium]|jgi:lysine 2,3-aminomutase|nr:KamA family radical SAM protein [Candidatus Omnitrophota bacterium]HPN57093.1 KamA family radical SAM protein [Candidatus Omnitrophota bacterium]
MKDSPSPLTELTLEEANATDQGVRVRACFPGVSDDEWNDWRWQIRNCFKTRQALEAIMSLTPDEQEGIDHCGQKLTMAIPPYFAALIDPDDPACPIRRQCVPTRQELIASDGELVDPCGEDKDSPVKGVVHRYPDRVLFLVSDQCAMYCRHCTRSRILNDGHSHFNSSTYDEAFHYILEHKEVRDVLVSGGDPLLLNDNLLEYLLQRIKSIPHVEFVRIGTRAPVSLPQRITPALLRVLKKYSPLWISIHCNHPQEITPAVREACGALADIGIPLGSQTVLLKGINDDPVTMKTLMHALLKIRVRPYYIYQCDPVVGTRHFRATIQGGLEIMEQLQGFTSGYAVPKFVLDVPGGGGKIPLNPNYIVRREETQYVLRNYAGELFYYLS